MVAIALVPEEMGFPGLRDTDKRTQPWSQSVKCFTITRCGECFTSESSTKTSDNGPPFGSSETRLPVLKVAGRVFKLEQISCPDGLDTERSQLVTRPLYRPPRKGFSDTPLTKTGPTSARLPLVGRPGNTSSFEKTESKQVTSGS